MTSTPARGRPHVNDVVVDDQVAAFDELDATSGAQERVLEICRVEHARRQGTIVGFGRSSGASERSGEQREAVVIDRAYAYSVNSRKHA